MTFAFGGKAAAVPGADCCGKPVGCTNANANCLYLRHPWKRALLFGDTDVRCQCKALSDTPSVWRQCGLKNKHEGPCELA